MNSTSSDGQALFQLVTEFCIEHRRGAALKKWSREQIETEVFRAIAMDTIEVVYNPVVNTQIDCVVIGRRDTPDKIHIVAAIARPNRKHTLARAVMQHRWHRKDSLTALRHDKKIVIEDKYLNKVLKLA